MRNFYIILVVLLFVIVSESNAQGDKKYVTFSGFVIDGTDDTPLVGAYVVNHRAGRGVFTNDRGYFILDVFPGDSLLFSYLGFKKQFHIIPKSVGLNYSAVVELSLDAKMLKEVRVYPFRTEDEFRTAFLEMDLPQARERELMEKNFNVEKLRSLAANQSLGSNGNYRYAMDQQLMHLQAQKQATMNPFISAASWTNFIRTVKSGAFTDKSWKKAEFVPGERTGRDNIFRNGGN